MLDGMISIVALSVVALLCLLGVFHPRYDDTLGQRIGMSVIAVWCILRIQVKLTDFDTEPVHMLLHLGMLSYALGTLRKILRAQKFAQHHAQTMQQLREIEERS